MSSIRRVAALAALALATAGLGVVAAQPAVGRRRPDARPGRSPTTCSTRPTRRRLHQPRGQRRCDRERRRASSSAAARALARLETGDLARRPTTGTVDLHAGTPTITFSDPEVDRRRRRGRGSSPTSAGPSPRPARPTTSSLTTFDPTTAGPTDAATPDWHGVRPTGRARRSASRRAADRRQSSPAVWPITADRVLLRQRLELGRPQGAGDLHRRPPGDGRDPTVAVETSYDGSAVLIDVAGTGFTAVTKPGDDGVYVALAPAGEFPETDDFEDQDKVADAEWVMPRQMADGTFAVTLDPDEPVPRPVGAVRRLHLAGARALEPEPGHRDAGRRSTGRSWPADHADREGRQGADHEEGRHARVPSPAAAQAAGKVTVKLTKKGQKAKTLTAKVSKGRRR